MADPDRWRGNYDDWKTTDPAEFDEPDGPCERCGGTGVIVNCIDGTCLGVGDCPHCNGDGAEVCNACGGRG